jgi:hypothetical protein
LFIFSFVLLFDKNLHLRYKRRFEVCWYPEFSPEMVNLGAKIARLRVIYCVA